MKNNENHRHQAFSYAIRKASRERWRASRRRPRNVASNSMAAITDARITREAVALNPKLKLGGAEALPAPAANSSLRCAAAWREGLLSEKLESMARAASSVALPYDVIVTHNKVGDRPCGDLTELAAARR